MDGFSVLPRLARNRLAKFPVDIIKDIEISPEDIQRPISGKISDKAKADSCCAGILKMIPCS